MWKKTLAYLALWSNIWNLDQNLDDAISVLKDEWITGIVESKRYKSTPMYFTEQEIFINSVIKCYTEEDPFYLLKICKKIENKLWREKNFQNGPRLIDIDIILYWENEISTSELKIPHNKMLERDFVLKPLFELYPNYTYNNKDLAYYIARIQESHIIQ